MSFAKFAASFSSAPISENLRRCSSTDRLMLEFVEGELFANVWQTDRIARISPQSGKVVGWIDLTDLLSSVYRRQDGAVLNGIAYDSIHKRLLVTGKLWPSIFEIQVVPKISWSFR